VDVVVVLVELVDLLATPGESHYNKKTENNILKNNIMVIRAIIVMKCEKKTI